jgi:hypothetical protein
MNATVRQVPLAAARHARALLLGMRDRRARDIGLERCGLQRPYDDRL